MAGIQKGWRRGETTLTNDNLFPPKKRWCISYSCSNKENETSFHLTLNPSMRQITCLLLMEVGEGGAHNSVSDSILAHFDTVDFLFFFFHAFLSAFAVFRPPYTPHHEWYYHVVAEGNGNCSCCSCGRW